MSKSLSKKEESTKFKHVDMEKIITMVVVSVFLGCFVSIPVFCIADVANEGSKAIATNFPNVTGLGTYEENDSHRSFISEGIRYYYESARGVNGNDMLNILASDDSDDIIMTIDIDTNKVVWKKNK